MSGQTRRAWLPHSQTVCFILGQISIHLLCSLTPGWIDCIGLRGSDRAHFATVGQRQGDHLDESPVHCRAANKRQRQTIRLTFLFKDCGTKPDNPGRELAEAHGEPKHFTTGGPSSFLCEKATTFCCEARVLNTPLLCLRRQASF